ncbi:MAG: AI-2E family transporter [Candidatus Nanopelagicales bacterium]|nr:AI-2E family transporter [Candidatus Nanopelagicales bacterium]MCF8538652.1 AI-2E family transporter [Candidatus Nanopelagicales bacterium]MCF8551253.1 AI-2E family transporter [Candidatus Nanopelagicales bacterium]
MSTNTPTEDSDAVPGTLKDLAGITWRLLVLLVGFGVIVVIFGAIFPVVFALFFAMLVTAWTQPVMRVIHKVLPKVISMILALGLITTAIVTILYIVITSTVSEGPKLISSLESGFTDLQDWLKNGPLKLSDDKVNSLISQASDYGQTAAKGIAASLLESASSLGTLVIAGSVFLFGVIFFLLQPEKIWNWFVGWLPKSIEEPVNVSGNIAWGAISGYTRGIVVIAFFDAVLVFIGLTILQVPLAPALAAVVFLGAFIPVIGAPIATFFAAVVALAERGPLIALLVILLTVIVGSFDGDVMQPLVMGKAVSLHPLAIILAIAAGSIALGIVGALIAVPIAGAVYGVAKYLTGRDPETPFPPTAPFVPTADTK